MFKAEPSLQYNESLIVSELERRFYLYLIGGEFEKLFYCFDADINEPKDNEKMVMSRIRLEVEVTQLERQKQIQGGAEDSDYKAMLDYMLKGRISHRLENQHNLLLTCPELHQLIPILKDFGKQTEFDEELLATIEGIPWLREQIIKFSGKPEFSQQLNLPKSEHLKTLLSHIGYPLFIWLLPRFCSEVLIKKMHASMLPIVQRSRVYGRLTSGAIATLVAEENIAQQEKWTIYMLAAINNIPLVLILNLINVETIALIEQQRQALNADPQINAKKLSVLDDYQFSGDALRDFLGLEEILKPHILETIGFEHFDPMPYLFGYAAEDSVLGNLFFKARAYAFYKQLFKTGRIHPHETAIFLKKYQIDKAQLAKLNEQEITSIASHIKLNQQLVKQLAPIC